MVGIAIPVANNQGNYIKNEIILKSTPAFVICPKCGYNGLTTTLTTCNASNCLCCLATSPISWCFFQLVRGKDLNCNDAIHVCPRCHAGLGIILLVKSYLYIYIIFFQSFPNIVFLFLHI